MKRQATDWEKIFENYLSDKEQNKKYAKSSKNPAIKYKQPN